LDKPRRCQCGRVFGDTVDRMDFACLAKVTALNVATLERDRVRLMRRDCPVTFTG